MIRLGMFLGDRYEILEKIGSGGGGIVYLVIRRGLFVGEVFGLT